MQDSDNKGFALYDEVASVVTNDLAAGGTISDFFGELDGAPDELLDEPKEFARKDEESEELSDVDLSAGSIDKSNDSVRVYLREMGMVPLLTREGEIELAKQIERGQRAVLKALSRSQLVVQIILDTKRNVERDLLPILEVMQAPETSNLSEEPVPCDDLKEQFFGCVLELDKLYRKSQLTSQKLLAV